MGSIAEKGADMSNLWEIHAIKYADRNTRTRADSFIGDDHPAAPHGMDYFVWLLVNGDRKIVVDTGYDASEGARRDRPIIRDPAAALLSAGTLAANIDTVIITHLHYDHAGGLDRFPNANFHLQEAEMVFATGPCMCGGDLPAPFTVDHVCQMVKRVYSGRVVFHDGDGQVAEGVTVHRTGGHSRGLQVVRVETARGPVCLASDAAHYYENFLTRTPFPIVADMDDMLRGFDIIQDLAGGDTSRVIPGHDPLVTSQYQLSGQADFVWRLDQPPLG